MTHWTTLRNLLYIARIKKTTHIYISYRPNLYHVHVPCVSLLIILVGGIDVRPIWIIWPKIAMWVPCMYVCVCPSATSKHPLPLSVVTIHIIIIYMDVVSPLYIIFFLASSYIMSSFNLFACCQWLWSEKIVHLFPHLHALGLFPVYHVESVYHVIIYFQICIHIYFTWN